MKNRQEIETRLQEREQQEFRMWGLSVGPAPSCYSFLAAFVATRGSYPPLVAKRAAALMSAASEAPYGVFPPIVFIHFHDVAEEGPYVVLHSDKDRVTAYVHVAGDGVVTEVARIEENDVFATHMDGGRCLFLRRRYWAEKAAHPAVMRVHVMWNVAQQCSNNGFRETVARLVEQVG
jgi:hypothetical protein